MTKRETEQTKRALPAVGTEEGARLARAYEAFDRGDFREARALAKALSGAQDAEVRASAAALLARLGVDPVALAVWALCLVLFVFTAYRYLS